MADLYSPNITGAFDGTRPQPQIAGNLQRAKVRAIAMRADLSTLTVTTADNVLLGDLPIGANVIGGLINASVTMGASAALAIGTNKTHASNGQYRAAAVFTAAAPTLFGVAANLLTSLTAVTPVYLTVGTADLPTAGILEIIIFYTTQN